MTLCKIIPSPYPARVTACGIDYTVHRDVWEVGTTWWWYTTCRSCLLFKPAESEGEIGPWLAERELAGVDRADPLNRPGLG